MVETVVGCWAEAWMVWGGGVQVSWVEEFGKVWRSVELGISGEVEMGTVRENGGVSGLALVVEGWR